MQIIESTSCANLMNEHRPFIVRQKQTAPQITSSRRRGGSFVEPAADIRYGLPRLLSSSFLCKPIPSLKALHRPAVQTST